MRTPRRTVSSLAGLLCLGIAAAAYGTLQLTFGPKPVVMYVRWAPDVDDTTRQEAEQRYSLSQGEPLEGRTWRYALNDPSRTNVRALVSDAVIEDTQNIERTAFRVSPSAPRLPDLTSHTWIPVSLRGVTVLCLFIGLIGISLGLIERAAPGTTATWFVPRQRSVGVSVALLVILSGALTALFRFLGASFTNDHFVHLTAAQQMFFGD